MTGAPRDSTAGALLVAAAALSSSLVTAISTPPFHAFDEQSHFDYAQRLAEALALPSRTVRCPVGSGSAEAVGLYEVLLMRTGSGPMPPLDSYRAPTGPGSRQTSGCSSATQYCPLYYVSAAATYRVAYAGTVFQRLFAARMASVLWGVLGALAAFLLGRWWFRSAADGILIGLLVALHPMVVFLSGVVNNDSAMLALSTSCLAAIASLLRAGDKRRSLVALGVAVALGSLTKYTFLVAAPFFFVLCVAVLGIGQLRSWGLAAAAFLPGAALAAAWGAYSHPATELVRAVLPQLGPLDYLRSYAFDWQRAREIWHYEFWMKWGLLDVRLPLRYYRLIGAVLAIAGAGLAIGWPRLDREERGLAVLTILGTAYVMAALYALEFHLVRRTGYSLLQGRYLLPLYPAHACAIVIGIRALGRRLALPIDCAWSAVALLACVQAASVASLLLRFYYA
ncbi:MAG: DUF2142 domain-containing protein [Myxococcales bacterium]